MRLVLPPTSTAVMGLVVRVVEPRLPESPAPTAVQLAAVTGTAPLAVRTEEGWPAWWSAVGDELWVAYRFSYFEAVAVAVGVDATRRAAVLAYLLAARLDWASPEPTSLDQFLTEGEVSSGDR